MLVSEIMRTEYVRCIVNNKDNTMIKHFITVLGNGKYEEVSYYNDMADKKTYCKTKYIQQAVICLMIEGKLNKGDKITVIMTDEARKAHWDKCSENQDPLGEILSKSYPDVTIDVVSIPKGQTNDEVWEIYNRIEKCVGNNEELYVDITHGFRYQPFLMMSVLSFMRVVNDNVNINGIFYGAYERGMTEAPILNLLALMNIMDWAQAAKFFKENGDCKPIYSLYMANKNKNQKSADDIDKVLNDVVCQIKKTTEAIECSRGLSARDGEIESEASILKSYNKYHSNYNKLIEKMSMKNEAVKESDNSDGSTTMLPPMAKLLKKADDELKVFQNQYEFVGIASDKVDKRSIQNLRIGIATVLWNQKYDHIQQAYTALEETIKTYLCVRYGLDETNQLHREDICKHICNYILKNKDKATLEVVYNAWEKHYGKSSECEKEGARELIHDLINGDLKKLLNNINSIRDFRNNINHFGFNKQHYTPATFRGNLNKNVDAVMRVMIIFYGKEELAGSDI